MIQSLASRFGTAAIMLGLATAPGHAAPLSFSVALVPPSASGDVLALGSPPGGTPAGLWSTGSVTESFADGSTDVLSFGRNTQQDPAGLYLGITSKEGGPTAPFNSTGQAVTGLFAAASTNSDFDLLVSGATGTEMTLLWGSVDDGNILTFKDNNATVGSVTGKQVLQAVADTAASGGIAGTLSFYVTVLLPQGFNEVVGTTSSNWFETSSLAVTSAALTVQSGAESVPEPAELGVTGLALVGLAHAIRRRRSARYSQGAVASTGA